MHPSGLRSLLRRSLLEPRTPSHRSCSVLAMDIEKLRRIPLFADLHDRTLERIAELSTEFEEPAGWVLVEVGQPWLGHVRPRGGDCGGPDPRRPVLGARSGRVLRKLALLTDDPRKARVRAKTSVRCLAISRSDFQELLKEEPEIALAMLPRLAERVDAPH